MGIPDALLCHKIEKTVLCAIEDATGRPVNLLTPLVLKAMDGGDGALILNFLKFEVKIDA